MSNWKLKIGHRSPIAFDALGVTAASLSLTTGARDSLCLTTNELIDTADAIPAFAKCELLDPGGTLRFTVGSTRHPGARTRLENRNPTPSQARSVGWSGSLMWMNHQRTH